MPDDIENLLHNFRPSGPPSTLREKILSQTLSGLNPSPNPNHLPRRWPFYAFRSALAALLLLSFALLKAANNLNRNSASNIGIGPPQWTPEAQQAADLIDPKGNAGRRYIALCLLAANAAAPDAPPLQGDSQ